MRLLPKSIHRCRRYPTKFNSGRDISGGSTRSAEMKRQSLSKKVRFEVFKRDSFTCQYCGKKAPEVILVVDHIEPIAKGGSDDMLNLITSCFDCNSRKSDRTLDDTTVLHKQLKQLAELQERKQQIEMMFEWQKSLMSLDDQVVEELSLFWHERVDPHGQVLIFLSNLRMVPRARLSCWFLRRAFGEELVSKFLDSPDCENIHPYAAPFTRCGQQDCEREFYRGLLGKEVRNDFRPTFEFSEGALE